MRLSRTFFLAAAILAVPAFAVMAQPSDATNNKGSNRSVTASPGTADSQAASGMHTGDVGTTGSYSTTRPASGNTAATNPHTPGATGSTVVPGNSSSMAKTSPGARDMQTQGRSGGGNR